MWGLNRAQPQECCPGARVILTRCLKYAETTADSAMYPLTPGRGWAPHSRCNHYNHAIRKAAIARFRITPYGAAPNFC